MIVHNSNGLGKLDRDKERNEWNIYVNDEECMIMGLGRRLDNKQFEEMNTYPLGFSPIENR